MNAPGPAEVRAWNGVLWGVRLILLGAAFRAVTLGVSYLPHFEPSNLPQSLAFLSTNVPLVVWAVAWIAAGIAALGGVWHGKITWLSGVAGMCILWAGVWGWAWVASILAGAPSREWVTFAQYAAWSLVLPGIARALASLDQLAAQRMGEPADREG